VIPGVPASRLGCLVFVGVLSVLAALDLFIGLEDLGLPNLEGVGLSDLFLLLLTPFPGDSSICFGGACVIDFGVLFKTSIDGDWSFVAVLGVTALCASALPFTSITLSTFSVGDGDFSVLSGSLKPFLLMTGGEELRTGSVDAGFAAELLVVYVCCSAYKRAVWDSLPVALGCGKSIRLISGVGKFESWGDWDYWTFHGRECLWIFGHRVDISFGKTLGIGVTSTTTLTTKRVFV